MSSKDFYKQAKMLDKNDKLSKYKKEFYLSKGKVYMDGNSLGLASKRAEKSLLKVLESWKMRGIDGWLQGENPWFYFAEKLGHKMAALVGALPEEVLVTGSATVNLHQLIATFFRPAGGKRKILTEEFSFPTDMYVIKSQLKLHGLDPEKDLVIVKSKNNITIDEEEIIKNMTNEIALIILPVAFYRSGQILNVKRLTEEAHKRDIIIGFDACHSIGILPHNFHTDEVDFALWCNYKYVNGGPGAEGGLFVHKKHFGVLPALAGWFASNKQVQFDMKHEFIPADGVGAYQMGTPHILSMAPLLGSLELFDEIGIESIREKSLKLTKFMMELISEKLQGFGFSIGTPVEEERRGGHIALQHEEAASICKALKEYGVIPDFRQPNIVRLAPSPMYTSFIDIFNVIETIKHIMIKEEYKKFANKREVVA